MSLFQVFKMVFGVIASVVILYFLVTYAGVYGTGQQDVQRSLIMKNFRQLADDVWLTGNPSDFDFSKMNEEVYFDARQSPPVFRFGNSNMQVTNPMFFRYGDSVFAGRSQLDFGWWKFSFVVAAPEMVVVFSPLQNTEQVWGIMRDITALLPDTTAVNTKLRYAFCGYPGGRDISSPMEKFEFQRALGLNYETATFYSCSAQLPSNYILVTVSVGCSQSPSAGICVNPDGLFYIAGSDREYAYMDGLDIIAAIIGGTGSDMRGRASDDLYAYKQAAFRESMKFAADIMANRAQLLAGKLAALITGRRIEYGSEPAMCAGNYILLSNALQQVSAELAQPDYYNNNQALLVALSQSKAAYDALAANGCEVPKS